MPAEIVGAALRAADNARQGLAAFEAESERFPTTRAAVIGSEDNQRHALSHSYKIFGALDLQSLHVTGLDALGPLGAVWMVEAALESGFAPAPELKRRVFADRLKRKACALAGALVCWRHLREAQQQIVQNLEAKIHRGETYWRSKPATPAQIRLLQWIEQLVQAETPGFSMPPATNRGVAYDLILANGGNPQLRAERDAIIIRRLRILIHAIGIEKPTHPERPVVNRRTSSNGQDQSG